MPPPVPEEASAAFRYVGFDVDRDGGELRCRYSVGGYDFEEIVTVEGGDWTRPGVDEAARLVFLLAGVSYYKAFAPSVVDLGEVAVRDGERQFLTDFYREGLGEFAFRNGLDLGGIDVVGGSAAPAVATPAVATPAPSDDDGPRPLVPFGGGLDSIVTVELLRPIVADLALFVVSRPGDRYEAIERALAAADLPVVRATRAIDPTILRSDELGFLNGHVPITGIISAIAVLAAVVHGRDAVVMSNEWSASIGNVEHDGRVVNHQYSKSLDFERGFGAVVSGAVGSSPAYFSLLRPFTELWIAERFTEHPEYRLAFRSCNRAFHIDPAQRLRRWCGQCDKCAFIDLVLSPFLTPLELAEVFDGAEPLADPALLERFRALLGTSELTKPWECVGDVGECRAAAVLAADRPDRAGSEVLDELLTELGPDAVADARRSVPAALEPVGEHVIPEPYAWALG